MSALFFQAALNKAFEEFDRGTALRQLNVRFLALCGIAFRSALTLVFASYVYRVYFFDFHVENLFDRGLYLSFGSSGIYFENVLLRRYSLVALLRQKRFFDTGNLSG